MITEYLKSPCAKELDLVNNYLCGACQRIPVGPVQQCQAKDCDTLYCAWCVQKESKCLSKICKKLETEAKFDKVGRLIRNIMATFQISHTCGEESKEWKYDDLV